MGLEIKSLSDEEKKVIQDERDIPLIAIINGLSAEERRKIYDSIHVIDVKYSNSLQADWVSIFRYYLGKNRERQKLDCSHEVVEQLVVEELLKGDGAVMRERFRIYHAITHRENITSPYDKTLEDFLAEVDKTTESLDKNYGQS